MSDALYVVKKGDYLKKIAANLYGDSTRWAEIANLNSLEYPYLIYPEQVLQLPPAKRETVVIDITAPKYKPAAAATVSPEKQAGLALSPATITALLFAAAAFLLMRR